MSGCLIGDYALGLDEAKAEVLHALENNMLRVTATQETEALLAV